MASSVPGATTVRPSGLSSSEAILATSLEEPMPTDAVRPPVAVRMRSRSACARALTPSTVRSGPAAAARSTYASSIDTCSTRGDTSASSDITSRELSR